MARTNFLEQDGFFELFIDKLISEGEINFITATKIGYILEILDLIYNIKTTAIVFADSDYKEIIYVYKIYLVNGKKI